jgi:hypothetical protein
MREDDFEMFPNLTHFRYNGPHHCGFKVFKHLTHLKVAKPTYNMGQYIKNSKIRHVSFFKIHKIYPWMQNVKITP